MIGLGSDKNPKLKVRLFVIFAQIQMETKVPRQRIRNSEAENLWSYKMDWELKVEETRCFVHLGFSQLLSPVSKYLGHTLIFKGGENWANISCLPLFSTVLASIK